MSIEPTPPADFSIDGRHVQPALNRIVDGEHTSQLEPKAMAVLITLAEEPGQVLSRRRLLDAVWAGEAVTDDVLTRAIGELRKVFGDSPSTPRVIETIRGRGYRLIATVTADPVNGIQDRPDTTEPEAEGGHTVRTVTVPVHSPATRSLQAAMVLVLLLATVVLGFLRFRTSPSERAAAAAPAPLRIAPLTGSPHRDNDPAVSPDGTAVAFSMRDPDTGQTDLYLKLLDATTPLRLTDDPLSERLPVFSPTGTRLAFVRFDREQCGIYSVAATGGPVQRLTDCPAGRYLRMAWSPDGGSLALSEQVPDDPTRIRLSLLSLSELTTQPLTDPPPRSVDTEPSFSPDGRWIAFSRSGPGRSTDVFAVSVQGGDTRRLTEDFRDVAGQTWSNDGRHVVFSSDRAGTYSLWQVHLDGGSPQWLAGGGTKIKHPSHARHAGVLAYEEWQYEINLWRVELAPNSEPEPLVVSTAWDFGPAYSPDGRHIAFTSNRSGSYELWLAQADGSEPRRLTRFDTGFAGRIAWSPNSRELAFVTFQQGRSDLYRMDIEDSVPKALTRDAAEEDAPSWSRDGRSIYFTSNRAGSFDVWRIAAEGGDPEPITQDGARAGFESWDGEALYWLQAPNGLWRRVLSPEGQVHQLPQGPRLNRSSGWTLGRRGIYFADLDATSPALSLLPWSTGEIQTIAPLPDMDRPSFSVSADGHWLAYASVDRAECDIMVAHNLPSP